MDIWQETHAPRQLSSLSLLPTSLLLETFPSSEGRKEAGWGSVWGWDCSDMELARTDGSVGCLDVTRAQQ